MHMLSLRIYPIKFAWEFNRDFPKRPNRQHSDQMDWNNNPDPIMDYEFDWFQTQKIHEPW